jgi:myo-inositol-1(or 4)-monophosphatase
MKKLAVKIAKEAGKILLENFHKRRLKEVKKEEMEFFTKEDIDVESLIVRMIRGSGTKCCILTEERGSIDLGDSSVRWIVDPLDGTFNYSRGIPHFATSIALEKNGSVFFGVVLDPYKRELFIGEKGKGAKLNGKPIKVSERFELKDCAVSLSYLPLEKHKKHLANFLKILPLPSRVRTTGCISLDFCYTACGRFDGLILAFSNFKIWDIAAGALILEEAGGVVSDFRGSRWCATCSDIVGGNKIVHEKLSKMLKGSISSFD